MDTEKKKGKEKVHASAAIIARNEAARIGRCLGSVVGLFDEVVVVVDSRSSDGTESIARSLGCKVFKEDWKGFGAQKQSAVEKCANDWVFVIDSDEVLPAETARKISEAVASPKASAYAFPRKNYFHEKWMRHGDWWPDWQVRLLDKRHGRFQGAIHEGWALEDGEPGKIDSPIEHYSFENYSSMLKTMDRYSTIIAEDMFFSRGARAKNALAPLFHAAWMFLRIYIIKAGFLEGFDGLVMALLKAGGSFFKYAKLLEIERGETGKRTEEKKSPAREGMDAGG